jgi:transposase
MRTLSLTDSTWTKILAFLRTEPHIYVGKVAKTRRFIEACYWITRSGSQWRLLPADYGRWNSVYNRFADWERNGVWERLLAHVATEPDMENVILDSTTVRAHPCAAGARHATGGQASQALGRSAGGFSTKIHLSVDGLGNPLRVRLSGGQRHDITQAAALLDGLKSQHVIADRGYAAADFRDLIVAQGAQPVIPPHPRLLTKTSYDTWLYRERHLIECLINKLKHFRRVFSRYDKLATRYLAFVHFVCALIWLR